MICWNFEGYNPAKSSTGFVIKCFNLTTNRTSWYTKTYSSEIGLNRALYGCNTLTQHLYNCNTKLETQIIYYIYYKEKDKYTLFGVVANVDKILYKAQSMTPEAFEQHQSVAGDYHDHVIV